MAGLCCPQQGGYCRAAAAMNLLLGVFHVLLPCFRPGEAQGRGERGGGRPGRETALRAGLRGGRRGGGAGTQRSRAALPFPTLPGASGPGAAGTCVLSLSARSRRAHPRSGGAVAGRGGRASAARAGEGAGGRLRSGCGAGRRRGRAVRRRPCSRGLLPLHAFRPRPRLAAFCPRALCRFVKCLCFICEARACLSECAFAC